MSSKIEAFTKRLNEYLDYVEKPWAQMFYELVWHQLGLHLSPYQEILEIGCGFGLTATELARQGSKVTAIEPTVSMLDLARQRTTYPIEFLAGSLEEASSLLQYRTFDWLICHNVLEYLHDAASSPSIFAGLLKSGGYLSLICHNPVSKVLGKAILEKDPLRARQSVENHTEYSKVIDTTINVYSSEVVAGWLEQAGFKIVARYGIQCVYGYINDNQLKLDNNWHSATFELEKELGKLNPYRDIARFYHLIVRLES